MTTKKFRIDALIQATFVSTLTFMLADMVVEKIWYYYGGISFLQFFENKLDARYSLQFHAVNILLFSGEMFVVMVLYGIVRMFMHSRIKTLIISIGIPLALALLILFQMVNLGIYPAKPALVLCTSMLIGFPVAVMGGAYIYNRIVYA